MEILGIWGYVWSCLSAFAALGVAWYLLDRSYGVHLYRWLYDLFHKDPMPASVERGFMYEQPTNRKVTVAFVISTLQSVYMIWNTEVNFLVELLMWIFEVPAVLFGFFIGPLVYRFLVKRSAIFDRIDELQEHVTMPDTAKARGVVQGGVRRFGEYVAAIPASLVSRFWDIVYPVRKTAPAAEVQQKKEKEVPAAPMEPIDSRKAFDRYTRRS